ncbi:MAG: peptidoglycan bridge formation glycyltransferase FemA/FemB family protein, partial [Anaerolineae bacterium]|nr:peptidoglycan bridge formation glycyltransferase FemA/FemB family protein [Anaerolineae bacterium]
MLSHPNAHILQCSGWGELKSGFGWYALRVREGECGAQILFRRLPLGFTIAYIPKGPVGVHWQAILPQIEKVCREHRAIFLKIEP